VSAPSPQPAWRANARPRPLGLLLATIAALIGLAPLRHALAPAPGWLALAAALLLVAVLRPALLGPLAAAWAFLGYLMSRIVDPLVMGAIFWLLFVPVAVGMRVFGRDALRLRRDRAAASYWIPRDERMDSIVARLRQQF
jgi:hypothetical protein